jgi:uncharacterized protein RhaS with RHS repeats
MKFGYLRQTSMKQRALRSLEYFVKDHLGSILAVAESDGSISMQYDYSPWGEQSVISGNNPAVFGFTGHYTGVGPTLAPFQLYHPQLGR